jgi:hypothetical protein
MAAAQDGAMPVKHALPKHLTAGFGLVASLVIGAGDLVGVWIAAACTDDNSFVNVDVSTSTHDQLLTPPLSTWGGTVATSSTCRSATFSPSTPATPSD